MKTNKLKLLELFIYSEDFSLFYIPEYAGKATGGRRLILEKFMIIL